MKVGSICTGIASSERALELLGIDVDLQWYFEIDKAAIGILEKLYPGVPNLGNLKDNDWMEVPFVEVLVAGYPCQPFSTAGARKGIEDERHLWPYIAHALSVLRPDLALFENVAGHLSLGFDTVLADLAQIGFDAEWTTVRASDVGAPHSRHRLFVAAFPHVGRVDADGRIHRGVPPRWHRPDTASLFARSQMAHAADPLSHCAGAAPHPDEFGRSGVDLAGIGEGVGAPGDEPARGAAEDPAPGAFAYPDGVGWDGGETAQDRVDLEYGDDGGWPQGGGESEGRAEPAADADCEGWEGSVLQAAEGGVGPFIRDWREYGPAIKRWEAITGRPSPDPLDELGRLNPPLVEWMMGIPPGLTEGLARQSALRVLGNSIVALQAAWAWGELIERVA